MHRSASWSKVAADYYMHSSVSSGPGLRMSLSMDGSEVPLTYDPIVELAIKKDKSRNKFSENAVHFIPLVLLLCGIVLWLCSNPDAIDVNVMRNQAEDSIAARIQGMTIGGDIDNDSDGTQTGFLPIEVDDHEETNKQSSKSDNFSRKLVKGLN